MASVLLIGLWMSCTSFITAGGLIYFLFPHMPQLFLDTLLYGKSRGDRKRWSVVQLLEVPKRWFTHFYVVGFLVNGYMTYVVASIYFTGSSPPHYVGMLLNFLVDTPETKTNAVSALLVISMMWLQNCRRLAECFFVSVYSKSTMNIAHYAMGILLYSTFSFAVLAESPSLFSYKITNIQDELHIQQLVGVLIFLWASYNHHKVHEQFAKLRQDGKGKVTTLDHKIPTGGWFELVSCPHYFFEILIYLAFIITTGFGHKTLGVIIIFVLDNQIVAGFISHSWYLKTFKNYPKHRNAVIPYLL